jgi:uncharacterized membrane protein
MLAILPGPLRLWPTWLPGVAGVVLILPTAFVSLVGDATRTRALRIERGSLAVLTLVCIAAVVVALAYDLQLIVRHSPSATGVGLLSSSVMIWGGNVVGFSLAYWLLDLGGPEARVARARRYPDFLFPPESAAGSAPEGWQPVYVDYLFLSFSTATAFSATDTLPITARAKLLLMLEATVSLITSICIISRAINILR